MDRLNITVCPDKPITGWSPLSKYPVHAVDRRCKNIGLPKPECRLYRETGIRRLGWFLAGAFRLYRWKTENCPLRRRRAWWRCWKSGFPIQHIEVFCGTEEDSINWFRRLSAGVCSMVQLHVSAEEGLVCRDVFRRPLAAEDHSSGYKRLTTATAFSDDLRVFVIRYKNVPILGMRSSEMEGKGVLQY